MKIQVSGKVGFIGSAFYERFAEDVISNVSTLDNYSTTSKYSYERLCNLLKKVKN